MKQLNNKYQAILQVVLLLAILIAVNVLASTVYQRIDLTKEGRFTLTEATQNLLLDLDDVVYVRIYLEGELNPGFRRLRNGTLDMLNEFRAYAGNDLEYEFIDPIGGTSVEERKAIIDQLSEKGLQPTRVFEPDGSESILFPGLIVAYKGRELAVPLLLEQLNRPPQETLNNSIALIEYNIANAIQKLRRPTKPAIAFLEGHGELPAPEVGDMTATLENYYVVNRFDITKELYIPPRYNAVIIARPTKTFEEVNKFKIDQYIMNGGRVLWLLENMATSLDSMQRDGGKFIALDYGLDIEDQLFRYGVRINFDLIQDLQCTQIPLTVGTDQFGNARQMRLFPWPYFPVINLANNEHPVTKNLNAVLGQFVATVDTIQTKAAIEKTILLTTSSRTRVMPAPIMVDVNDVRQNRQVDDARFNAGPQPIAVALEGVFPSPFKNRLAPETIAMIDTIEGVDFREESKPTRMVVISDGDMIRNDYDPINNRISPLGYYKFTKENFANKALIQNAVEWLTDENGIIAARSKDIKLRLLDAPKVKAEKTTWQLVNLGIPLLALLVFGIGYNYVRKRKYAS
ncbi:MAG: gliding motility-associated ABC transporter substrate-binding protein GldG [Chitinophagales bacterium]